METLKAIAVRKSTRAYRPEQIKEQELEAVLSAACMSPVGMGRHDTVHLTVIQNRELLNKIAAGGKVNGPHEDRGDPFYGAPTMVLVSADKSAGIPGAGIEAMNAACIIENMLIAATDLGLGSVYLMGVVAMAINTNKELQREMGIPEGFEPVAAVAIGYPVEPLTEVMEKRPISINVIA